MLCHYAAEQSPDSKKSKNKRGKIIETEEKKKQIDSSTGIEEASYDDFQPIVLIPHTTTRTKQAGGEKDSRTNTYPVPSTGPPVKTVVSLGTQKQIPTKVSAAAVAERKLKDKVTTGYH